MLSRFFARTRLIKAKPWISKMAIAGGLVFSFAALAKLKFGVNSIALCQDGGEEKLKREKDPRRKPLRGNSDPFHRSRQKRSLHEQDLMVFGGSSNKKLAEEIADHLGINLSNADVGKFSDGESFVRINETVRGKDCYIIQSTCPPVNDNLMELLLMISTLRRASAKSIIAVIPYYGYARQDRKTENRVSIAAADVARLLQTMGVDSIISIDLHCWQIEGFFENKVPVINLSAGYVGMEFMIESLDFESLDQLVIVSPDAGGVGRAKKFQDGLISRGFPNIGLAMIIKQRAGAGKIARMDLVGDVKDKDCLIVDDMIDTAGTLCKAATELKEMGARRVYAFATHGVFSGPAPTNIKNSELEKILITNTIPLSQEFINTVPKDKYAHISMGTFIAETIRRIYHRESVSGMFEKGNYRL